MYVFKVHGRKIHKTCITFFQHYTSSVKILIGDEMRFAKLYDNIEVVFIHPM